MRVEKNLLIVNKLGLHARAATQLALLANQFDAEVTLQLNGKSASAASVLGVLMLEGNRGKEVTVISEGEDAEQALAAIEHLIADKFNESE